MTTSHSSTARLDAAAVDQVSGRLAGTPLPRHHRWQRMLAAILAAHTSSVPF